jgi:mRNA interferase MazF
MNAHLATVVVCPITSQSKPYPTRVQFLLEGHDNWIVIDQIRTIDRSRTFKTTGRLNKKTIAEVKAVLKETSID